jgi:hypothetical protein
MKPLTVPVEFKFSNRTARKAPPAVADKLATSSMFKPIAGKHSGEKKLTVPKPFKFHVAATKKETVVDAGKAHSPYVPLAEKIRELTKTPDRFKKNVAVRWKVIFPDGVNFILC